MNILPTTISEVGALLGLYYEKHLFGRVKMHFLGRVARLLLVLAAKNTYFQGWVMKPPLKTHFLGQATPTASGNAFSGAGPRP